MSESHSQTPPPLVSAPPVPLTLGSLRFSTLEVGPFRITEATYPPLLRLAPHVHDRGCFGVMLRGSFDLMFSDRTHECPPDTVFSEPLGEAHGNQVGSSGARTLVVQPDPARVELLEPFRAALDSFLHLRLAEVARLARRLARELRAPDAMTPLVAEGQVFEMLATTVRCCAASKREPGVPGWLRRVEEMLCDRGLTPLRSRDLALAAGVHPVHLARVFRARHGISPGEYLRRRRLEWAAQRLAESTVPIADIALEAGFADQSHLTRSFHRWTGLTPFQYRRSRACRSAAGNSVRVERQRPRAELDGAAGGGGGLA